MSAIGFKGTLYIVEPNEYSLREVVKEYKQILNECNIIPVQMTMEDAIAELPEKVDAIIANHPLDDMILGSYMNKKEFADYFGEKFGTSIEKTKLFLPQIYRQPFLN